MIDIYYYRIKIQAAMQSMSSILTKIVQLLHSNQIFRSLVNSVRSIRIYQAGHYVPGQTLELSPSGSQHVGVVLRKQPGDQVILFSGDNRELDATITHIQKKKVYVTIHSERVVSRESPRLIHLAQAISKGERMEFVVQKAVELGVTSINPLITAQCSIKLDQSRLEKKREQWQAIAIAACEQCGRNQIPIINPPSLLKTYLAQADTFLKFVLDPNSSQKLKNCHLNPADSITLLIGPEGGFSSEEMKQIILSGFHSLNLGPRILRTETAAIAMLSILQALGGDL